MKVCNLHPHTETQLLALMNFYLFLCPMKVVRKNLPLLILSAAMTVVTPASAAGPGGGPPPPAGPPPPPGLPIDQGILLLLIAAITYGGVVLIRKSMTKPV